MLPLQALLSMTLLAQGPLHSHRAGHAYADAHDHDHEHEHEHGRELVGQHDHDHANPARHFHASDDADVLVDEHHKHEADTLESALLKLTVSAMALALIPNHGLHLPMPQGHRAQAAGLLAFHTRALPRLERPPSRRPA